MSLFFDNEDPRHFSLGFTNDPFVVVAVGVTVNDDILLSGLLTVVAVVVLVLLDLLEEEDDEER